MTRPGISVVLGCPWDDRKMASVDKLSFSMSSWSLLCFGLAALMAGRFSLHLKSHCGETLPCGCLCSFASCNLVVLKADGLQNGWCPDHHQSERSGLVGLLRAARRASVTESCDWWDGSLNGKDLPWIFISQKICKYSGSIFYGLCSDSGP